jgi:hypothetical protein
MIIAGIIILLVGGMITVIPGFIDEPDDWDDRDSYEDTVRNIITMGNLTEFVGLMVLSFGLVLGATRDESLHPYVQLGNHPGGV